MKSTTLNSPYSLICLFLLAVLFITGISGCAPGDSRQEEVIDILTESMEFQMPDTIRPGWQTFRYTNKSYETHFFLLDKYPEGKDISDGKRDVISVFQQGMDSINAGKADAAMAVFGTLPPWFSEVVFLGGSGLISPGETAVTTLKMEPGYYVVECYVKMENGIFHAAMGMVTALVVAGEDTGHRPGQPDVRITISREGGIEVEGTPTAGDQLFSVYFKDQGAHEHFVGHDVNLVRLDENADLEKLEQWMNWSVPDGLRTPSPEGVTFLGGVNESPAGSTGYFKATLTPGSYAFISEVPNASGKGMLVHFLIDG